MTLYDYLALVLLTFSGGMHVYGKQQLAAATSRIEALTMQMCTVAWMVLVPMVIVGLIRIHLH